MNRKNSKFIVVALSALSFLFASQFVLATDASKGASSVIEKAGEAAGIAEKININTASVEMLEKIPGIGPTISSAIETYRSANGAFASLSELTKVEGIDAGLLEKITPFLTL